MSKKLGKLNISRQREKIQASFTREQYSRALCVATARYIYTLRSENRDKQRKEERKREIGTNNPQLTAANLARLVTKKSWRAVFTCSASFHTPVWNECRLRVHWVHAGYNIATALTFESKSGQKQRCRWK